MTDNDPSKPPNCKVVLLGDSGVGKTCIISRYISGNFDPNSASTNGASYASKNVTFENSGKSLMLDIWDTAGQEKYKALTKFFYKDAAVAILVYDITLRQSFDNLKEYWYKQVQENGERNVVLAIAGNKSDLYETEAVPEEEAKEYARLQDLACNEEISWEVVQEYEKTHENIAEKVALDEEKVYKAIKNYFQN